MTLEDKIHKKLSEALQPKVLKVINQSHLHAGHAGDDGSGESHFKIEIQAESLVGIPPVKAQRKIFHILVDEMKIIHALSIKIIK